MNDKNDEVAVIGYGLAFIYGIGLFIYLFAFIVSLFNAQYVLHWSIFAGKFDTIEKFQKQAILLGVFFFPQWVAALGIVRYREWARWLLLISILLTCFFILYEDLVLPGHSSFPASAFVMLSLVIMLFFFQPQVKAKFLGTSAFSLQKRILVVDDDKGLVKMLKAMLAGQGFEVFTALTGEAGIQLAKRHRPGLIILDVILPGIKGREVCLLLKEDSATRQIPVVFLTSKDSPEDVTAELAAGGISHITKPVNSQKLLSEIKRIMGV